MDMLLSTQTDKTTAQRYIVVVVVEQPTTTTTRAETTINNKSINTVIPTVFGRRIFIYFLKKVYDHSLTIAACRQHCSE